MKKLSYLFLYFSLSTTHVISQVIPTINCETSPHTIKLKLEDESRTIILPSSGKFFQEAHYVTTLDKFKDGDYPESVTQNISSHLTRALNIYKNFDPNMTFNNLFSRSTALGQRQWTPSECGEIGQGSVGIIQLSELTPEMEMWMLTMMWAPGYKPQRGTKFLITYNEKNVVLIAGYETGPGDLNKLGGITTEAQKWLGANNESNITLKYLVNQSVNAGPCNCR